MSIPPCRCRAVANVPMGTVTDEVRMGWGAPNRSTVLHNNTEFYFFKVKIACFLITKVTVKTAKISGNIRK